MTKTKLFTVVAVLTLGLAACSQLSTPPSPSSKLTLSTPSSETRLSSQAINLTAGGTPITLNVGSVPAGQTVTWSATPAGVGTLVGSGSRGTYTPPATLDKSTNVTITVRLSSGASGSLVLTIAPSVQTSPAPTPPPPAPTPPAPTPPPAPSTPPSSDQAAMLSAINAVRAQARSCGITAYPAVPALKWNTQLEAAALLHSQDMANKNYFSHTSQDGRSPWDRIRAQGYPLGAGGENIAAGQSSVASVIDGWVKSPGHCANLMSTSYTEVGMAKGENASSTYKIYWTQIFAKPI